MEEEKIFGEKQIGDLQHCGSSIPPTANSAAL
jgi:hypothetical protein